MLPSHHSQVYPAVCGVAIVSRRLDFQGALGPFSAAAKLLLNLLSCCCDSATRPSGRGLHSRHQHSTQHSVRGVAQSGSAPGSGPGGRRFESSRPDHLKSVLYAESRHGRNPKPGDQSAQASRSRRVLWVTKAIAGKTARATEHCNGDCNRSWRVEAVRISRRE
jgi:hypothetical protein